MINNLAFDPSTSAGTAKVDSAPRPLPRAMLSTTKSFWSIVLSCRMYAYVDSLSSSMGMHVPMVV